MSKKHVALWILVGWIIAAFLPPQMIVRKVQGAR